MAEEQNAKYKAFIEKYWPLPEVNIRTYPYYRTVEIDPAKFKRQIWYCNISGKAIPELQEFNECGERFEYQTKFMANSDEGSLEEKEDVSICCQYYQDGYTNYRIYPCGHAFLDIHLMSSIFDYGECPYYKNTNTDEEMSKLDLEKKCPCESQKYNGNAVSDRCKLYNLISAYTTGTIVVKPNIPTRYDYLPYLAKDFMKGDIIDVDGYRGTGYRIHDGEKFGCDFALDVEFLTNDDVYYPNYKLEYLKLRSYRYYIPFAVPNRLLFENGIEFNVQFQDEAEKFFFSDSKQVFAQLEDWEVDFLKKNEKNISQISFLGQDNKIVRYFKQPGERIGQIQVLYKNQWLRKPVYCWPDDETWKAHFVNVDWNNYVRLADTGLEIFHDSNWMPIDENGFVPYPFNSAQQATAYLNCPFILKARVSDHDIMVLNDDGKAYFTDTAGLNREYFMFE